MLVISAKGYQEQEISVVDKTTLTIILVKAAEGAGEMLVAVRIAPKRVLVVN